MRMSTHFKVFNGSFGRIFSKTFINSIPSFFVFCQNTIAFKEASIPIDVLLNERIPPKTKMNLKSKKFPQKK